MPLSVFDLVRHPALSLELSVAGRAHRVVRWVHATEMPNPSRYLQGDEVVLTAGLWHLAGTSSQSFVDALVTADVAAIGFGTTGLVPSVPPELADICNEAELALFHVPETVPFIAITQVFVDHYVDERHRVLMDVVRRNEQLVRAARRGRGLSEIIKVLSQYVARSPGVLSTTRGWLAWTGDSPRSDLLSRLAGHARSSTRVPVSVLGHTAFPVTSTEPDQIYLVVRGDCAEISPVERAAVEQALAFVSLELGREAAVHEGEQRFAGEIFKLIDAGDTQIPALEARLEAFNLDPAGPLVAAALRTTDSGLTGVEARKLLSDGGIEGVAAVRGEEVLVIASWTSGSQGIPNLAQRLRSSVGGRAVVGVGRAVQGARRLSISLAEARSACRYAQRFSRAGYATYLDIASHAEFLVLENAGALQALRLALLHPLMEHDDRHHTDLVRTLTVFLGSNGHYQLSARALHVHVNTLRLRLARIETLTGRQLSRMDDRVDFFLALRVSDGDSGTICRPDGAISDLLDLRGG